MKAIDSNGHLFSKHPTAGSHCIGCGHSPDAPEAGRRCGDAEGLAADMEAMADRVGPGTYKIWVQQPGTGTSLVTATPLAADALDAHGHLWMFDGGGSDLDDPYTCGLCLEPKWRRYGEACEKARPIEEINAERSAWIREHAVGTAFFVPDGQPYAVAVARLKETRRAVPTAA